MSEVEFLHAVRGFLGGAEALPFWQTVTRLGDGGLVWIAFGVFLLFFKPFPNMILIAVKTLAGVQCQYF